MTVPNYKEMYIALFREATKAINILQAAQQKTEEIYIADDTEDNLIIIRPNDEDAKLEKE